MKEKPTKTYFGRVLAFMLVMSMLVCTLHGCGGGDDPKDTGGNTTADSAVEDGVSSSDESASSGSSDESTNSGDDSEEEGKSTTKKTSEKTTKKTSEKTTKKTTGSKSTTKKTSSKTTKSTTKATTTKVTTTKSNTYYAPRVYSNSAPGTLVFTSDDGSSTIDYSNTASGYIMFMYSGAYSNIRVQVTGPNGVTQTYPVFSKNTYEALPLTGGSGNYTVTVAVNNGGTSYIVAAQTSIGASLSYSTVAYSRPNIICNYNASTSCVQYAAQLTRGCDTEIAKVEAIYKYVVNNFRYDHGKASSVSSSAYIPNLNSTWSTKSGICYDYAATMAAMLRTQGIPTKVVAGYVSGSTYHAWISAYIQGVGWIDNIIYFNGNTWKLMDPTFASTGGIGTDWSTKYSYAVRYTY